MRKTAGTLLVIGASVLGIQSAMAFSCEATMYEVTEKQDRKITLLEALTITGKGPIFDGKIGNIGFQVEMNAKQAFVGWISDDVAGNKVSFENTTGGVLASFNSDKVFGQNAASVVVSCTN